MAIWLSPAVALRFPALEGGVVSLAPPPEPEGDIASSGVSA